MPSCIHTHSLWTWSYLDLFPNQNISIYFFILFYFFNVENHLSTMVPEAENKLAQIPD